MITINVSWVLFIGALLWIALVAYEFSVVRKKAKLLNVMLKEAEELIKQTRRRED